MSKNMDLQLEVSEWIISLKEFIDSQGEDQSADLIHKLRAFAQRNGVQLAGEALNSPYINTINAKQQPPYPGDTVLETKIENINRWNAMAMVLQGYDSGEGVGGHIATYASAASMYEVGFNHFFKKKSDDYDGDLVSFQPHAAPGIYARAFLEGRLSENQLKNFRRELQKEGGLPSYPHPRRMPDFWEIPSASMGLIGVSAIYQARFQKYLENRGLKSKKGGNVWAFVGDGEMDEPETLGTLNIAVREQLDNLVLVVNCNLQRLDGPVRGNGKIIQELERSFLGAGWNVTKVIWGSEWDELLARDHKGILVDRMQEALDGDYQMYSVLPGDKVREHWVKDNPELEQLMQSLSDEEIRTIRRGGHDYKKIFAAFKKAGKPNGKPSVILMKTLKGYGMGSSGEGKNTTHQKKNMSSEERVEAARRFGIPLSEAAAAKATFYKPAEDSPEMRYMRERRKELGGFLPERNDLSQPLKTPGDSLFDEFYQGTGGREVSTTMVLVRIIAKLLRDETVKDYIVPIIPDEARTFGMDGLFRHAGIYQPKGQLYEPVDTGSISYYRESTDGQILQEGICEAGALASFMAAGSAYAMHGLPMIPFYIFYSIFGFQRVGDMIWACGDMMCKGFLIGGTSGRTTLNGEGVQHQDGHSHILSSIVPNMKSYDPSFAYELAVIIKDGIHRMYELQEKIFYYITVANENYVMPIMPKNVDKGIIKGMYRYQKSSLKATKARKAHLMGSGSIMIQVLEAAHMLEEMNISTDIWSVTSYTELHREAMDVERAKLLSTSAKKPKNYLENLLEKETGVFVSASDYVKSWGMSISKWMPGSYHVLGTDGYGLSESRSDLRNHFEISAKYIVLSALQLLKQKGLVTDVEVIDFIKKHQIDIEKKNPAFI
ncbi:pyruvate dehydrogenase (acetyl-transferring), homodimeric type [Aquimarina sp. RZ0]|uniref:pyruvate dehydrogenase (acetyl-transferring), homodimeric type n=1 Tax=Aquimarina sp. RZ0 TaxID=2607730 RepID=UPI0011F31276|nr:pyruvate dehydrogenase (acetyl-transferring), homodimeric type [Aquimarina sp. RZ0]KAA1244920.1 pyruvate dehydrogenase (acetyl-transferring), homodimeric type [Aquimarina sp. RZ0]